MTRRPQGWEHNVYAGMSSADIHRAAVERVRHYSAPCPETLQTRCHLLRDAWVWVEQQHRPRAKR